MKNQIEDAKQLWLEQPIEVDVYSKSLAFGNSALNCLSPQDRSSALVSIRNDYIESKSVEIGKKIIDDTLNFVMYLIDPQFESFVQSDPMQYNLKEKLDLIYGISSPEDIMEDVPDVYEMLQDMIVLETFCVDVPIGLIKTYHDVLKESYEWQNKRFRQDNYLGMLMLNTQTSPLDFAERIEPKSDVYYDTMTVASYLLNNLP
ncbi:MAG: hypothetical protein K0B02_04615 [DPANN group archaeon]|nr:hypothetical protein [DPANN group archaeon]